MAKLTWLGARDERGEIIPPDVLTWAGLDFPKGKVVEVSDESMIRKAKGNPNFKVEEEPAGPENVSLPYPTPETWTNDSPEPRKRGGARPPRVRENDNGD